MLLNIIYTDIVYIKLFTYVSLYLNIETTVHILKYTY